jgi:hypothetical protein
MITEKNKKLIERVIGSFDWDAIAKIYKIFEKGVGTDSQKISGISRISYKKVTPDDIKKEITAVVTYIVENDIPSLEYDIWNIIWINGEWDIEIEMNQDGDQEDTDQNFFMPILDSRLEIRFVPQKSVSHEYLDIEEGEATELDSNDYDEVVLNNILSKAVKEEKYELASKLTDIINEFYRKMKKETRTKKNEKNKKA